MREIIAYFLRLGAIGFGGPVALVAQMQKDLIEDRQWMDREEFATALSLIKSMPGALAFSTASFLGTIRGGFWGGVAAGISLVLPAFLIMIFLAAQYDQYYSISWVNSVLGGMQAGALALILASVISLGKPYKKKISFYVMVTAAVGLAFVHASEPLIILGFGFLHLIYQNLQSRSRKVSAFAFLLPLVNEKIQDAILICLKAGAIVFGTGLAIVPVLEKSFVAEMHWMSHSEFMTALAFGQMTPGPILITVTFVGYKIAGWAGAFATTIAIFFPCGFHMTTWFPKVIHWLRTQKWIDHFVFGAMSAVIGTLIVISLRLGSEGGYLESAIALVAFAAGLKWKIPSWAVIIGCGVIGLALLR